MAQSQKQQCDNYPITFVEDKMLARDVWKISLLFFEIVVWDVLCSCRVSVKHLT